MKIRKECELERLYGHTHPIKEDSAELVFMRAVCSGDIDTALSYFRDTKLFGGIKSAVDTPYGRFEGLDGIRSFAEDWLSRFNAQAATISPIIQTISSGRVALEAVINFEVDGEINQVPMFIIGDFRTMNTLDEIRMYCHYTFVPNAHAYRKPMFNSAYLEAADPDLLTGAIREYFAALHHCPAVDVERIMNCTSDDCVFGGYTRWDQQGNPAKTREALRNAYEYMATYIPRCVGMRFETIIDDGRTCVVEWVHIVSRAGQEELSRIAMSGVSAYERNEYGLICSIRISDYAGCEKTIEWDKVDTPVAEAKSINFVESFPPHVGRKSLEE